MIAYSLELRERLTTNLTVHPRLEHPLDGRKHAAVAVVLVDSDPDEEPIRPAGADADEEQPRAEGRLETDAPADARLSGTSGGAAFLLCRRTTRLSGHPGQWALPGGRIDPGESVFEAALREVDEELGLALPAGAVLGLLDDYPTRSGYVITPVVVWGGARPVLEPSLDEVWATFKIGLHTLRDTEPTYVTIPESDRPVVQIPLGDHRVHAPTGAVLLQFRNVALGGHAGERVDHLEQPVFAWR